jgi:glycosyltransferase involved in cell wall biosynthesis
MTRIAVVTPILPVPQDMTRGRFIYETARALSRQADVRVFLTQAQYPQANWLQPSRHKSVVMTDSYSLPGIEIEPVTYPALPLISRISNGLVSGLSLLPRIARYSPDILIGYWTYPEGAGAEYVGRKLGKPVVIGALGTDINDRQGVNAWLTRRTLQAADRIVFVSQAMTRHAIDTYGVRPERCATVVNGINTAVFHPQDRTRSRQALDLPADAPVIVYVGRLIEAKGLRELVASVTKLRQTRPDLRTILIGEGPYRETLKGLITDAGQQDHIILAGGQLPERVAQYINGADVLTLPSWSEGYPNVLVEALACGCPVVATNVGGIPEIVTAANGLLVPPKDAGALAAALDQSLKMTWDRPGISRNMSRTWDDVARETLDVCRALTP